MRNEELKQFGDLTVDEKKELLFAWADGKTIEISRHFLKQGYGWQARIMPGAPCRKRAVYRVAPTKVELIKDELESLAQDL